MKYPLLEISLDSLSPPPPTSCLPQWRITNNLMVESLMNPQVGIWAFSWVHHQNVTHLPCACNQLLKVHGGLIIFLLMLWKTRSVATCPLSAHRQIDPFILGALVHIIPSVEEFSILNTALSGCGQHKPAPFPSWDGRGITADCIHPHFMGDLFY